MESPAQQPAEPLATDPAQLTPMMRQWQEIRAGLPPGTLLLFHLGDFYELFGPDAEEASEILNLALTKRGGTPMCGVPLVSARSYIEKLIAAGKKVAVCDQIGEPVPGKLVRRQLTHILSAGALDDLGLEDRAPNYLATAYADRSAIGLAWADLSTGEFRAAQPPSPEAARNLLARVQPSELLASGPEIARALAALPRGPAITEEPALFDPPTATQALCEHFGVLTLDAFGCAALPAAQTAAAALLAHLRHNLRRDVSHFRRLITERSDDVLILDATSLEHLEVLSSRSGRQATLLGVLDRTRTPPGARTLRRWLLEPLRDPAPITARQDFLQAALDNPAHLAALRETLAATRDSERAISRLSLGTGTPRDLAALAATLAQIPALRQTLAALSCPLAADLHARLHPLPDLTARLQAAIEDQQPANWREGGFIRPGFDDTLDSLRRAAQEGKQWIASLQEREIARTGIKSLKVRYNSVFGYYIEVTKANLGLVPPHYQRKQTTVGGERFITPELKEMEGRILGAEERARSLELEIFQQLRQEAVASLLPIQETAAALGALDALCSLAETARLFGYTRPVVDSSLTLHIEQGRHPVLDARPGAERFVPNDTLLHGDAARLAIITGPNMAGKSTYIRQVALLVLMAQAGSFLPAKSARIGVADRIFTRVGASDDLAGGRSTFLVEMSETAAILHHATPRSLVILDEIGRGTSTFDGLSIAWSVAEYLHDVPRCRTLFATHYHELTDLERTRDGVINLNVAVREWNGQIIFLHQILPGRADQSYGIHVAQLAGLPPDVIARARQILKNLEKTELNAEGKPSFAAGARRRAAAILEDHPQLPLFPQGNA